MPDCGVVLRPARSSSSESKDAARRTEAGLRREAASRGVGEVRIGFVPLIDAAPLVAAKELGFFSEEGLAVVLERQLGWGNIRDKLTGGHLDAAHSLLGLPVASNLPDARTARQTVALMALGTGGDGITLSRSLGFAGAGEPFNLARAVASRRGGHKLVFGHVFGVSVHHYLLRRWLESAGVNPDKDVELVVLPPPQISGQMKKGYLAGYCVGEPWNTVAAAEGYGLLHTLTTDIVADHPDKVLAVRRDWLGQNAETAVRLCRAVIRGCAFCEASGNRTRLAALLAGPDYLDLPPALLEAALRVERAGRAGRVRSFGPAALFPDAGRAAWLLSEMQRWGHLPAETDIPAVSRAVMDTVHYRAAAADLGVICPPGESVVSDGLAVTRGRTPVFSTRF